MACYGLMIDALQFDWFDLLEILGDLFHNKLHSVDDFGQGCTLFDMISKWWLVNRAEFLAKIAYDWDWVEHRRGMKIYCTFLVN